MKTPITVRILVLGVLLSALLGAAPARAQVQDQSTSTSMATTQADQPETASAGLPIGIQATSFFYGPRLDDPGSGEVPTTYIDSPSGVSLQNQLGLRYDLNNDLSVMPVFDFELLMSDPMGYYKDGQYASLTYDSFIKVNHNNLASVDLGENSLSLSGDVRYYAPTSDFSRVNNSLGSFRLSVTPTVQLAHSSWSFSLVNFVRYFVQRQAYLTNDRLTALPRVMLYTGPLVNYQLNEKVGMWLLGEASVTFDTRGVANTTDRNRTLVDFEPGFDVKVGEHMTISPYLNWFTRQPLKTTTLNLTANLTI